MNNEEKAVKFEAICQDVLQWASERNLLKLKNAPKQALKVVEELGEFVGAHLKGKELETQKEFGDVIVTVIVLNAQDLESIDDSLTECTISYINSIDKPVEHYKKEPQNTIGGILKIIGDIEQSLNSGFYKDRILGNKIWSLIDAILRFARLNNLDALHCLELAYNNIKDRQGKTENGVFIKQSDLEKGGSNE